MFPGGGMMGDRSNWRKRLDGPARLSGDGVYLRPGVAPLRPEETAGAGADAGKGDDRIPPRLDRTESHVRSGNEEPGAGNRTDQASCYRLSLRHVQL